MITREQHRLMNNISYDIGDDLFGYILQNDDLFGYILQNYAYARRDCTIWDSIKYIRIKYDYT
jgi:hypothetical protein